jgi:hypothetical protein
VSTTSSGNFSWIEAATTTPVSSSTISYASSSSVPQQQQQYNSASTIQFAPSSTINENHHYTTVPTTQEPNATISESNNSYSMHNVQNVQLVPSQNSFQPATTTIPTSFPSMSTISEVTSAFFATTLGNNSNKDFEKNENK